MDGNKNSVNQKIIFFDGICHLCNGFVDFVIQNETSPASLAFAPLQGQTAKELLPMSEREKLDSVIYWEDGKIHRESDAILKILGHLRFPYSWITRLGYFIPDSLRNIVYRWVARNRYLWFGQRETCRLPLPHERNQLLP